MKYLAQLLHTKAPPNARLLDLALVLSILPHLFVAKSFMLIYVAIALFFILKNIQKQSLLMLLGLMLITLSFFTSYNFSDFSKMQFFVSLISSLLIFAVTLQRLTKETNIYIKISPILLMILSFFFYNSIFMLFYSIATLFTFVLLYVWSKMDASLIEVIKFTTKLFLLSLPLVTILFLVFPRISIEKSDFGFRAEAYVESGYDGEMRVNTDAITLSNKIVMEILFEDENISNAQLYFRGSTLTKQVALEWIKDTSLKSKDRLLNAKDIKEYEMTIYPHAKNWMYALDMPLSAPKKTILNADYTISSDKPLYEKKKFLLSSALNYKLDSQISKNHLSVDLVKNERTYEALKEIREKELTNKEKAQELLSFFKMQGIAYTLSPKDTDLEDFTDSFLLESKNGYCVHFASAFASSARMLGIPSRVVTGFKADKKNMINNYLLVKASDAHAWVELYFLSDGWLRYDPTATARAENLSSQETNSNATRVENSYFTKVNHYFLYSKYIINNWILEYNRVKQMEIFDKLLNDTLYLLKFVFGFLMLVVVSFLLFFLLQSSKCEDKLMCEMQKLLKILRKFGLCKNPNESMQEFLQNSQEKLGVDLQETNRLYHKIKYTKKYDKMAFNSLKKEIKKLRSLKKSSLRE